MGKNNRERRAAKARARRADGSKGGSSSRPPLRLVGPGPNGGAPDTEFDRSGSVPPHEYDRAAESRDLLRLFDAAVVGAGGLDGASTRAWRNRVDDLFDRPVDNNFVLGEVAGRIEAAVPSAWEKGWQPADVVRFMQRGGYGFSGSLATAAISADARRYLGSPLIDARWLTQLDELGIDLDINRNHPGFGRPWLADWAARYSGRSYRLDDVTDGSNIELVIDTAFSLLTSLARLWPMVRLMAPPLDPTAGATPADQTRVASSVVDPKLLERVRALLAKAESSQFEAEAESFTTKAQQLMARYSIDHAMVAQAGRRAEGATESPSAQRMSVDDPYASAKASLLGAISHANRCSAVWAKDLGFSTVFGFSVDLQMVELLYTSLLIQATTAMVAAGRKVDERGRSRTRSFRQSFLMSFAHRIGQRLQAATDATQAQAASASEHGTALVPVLAERAERVIDARNAVFPRLGKSRSSVTNGEGWAAGRVAADNARLGPATSLPSR